jgi:hypothetical protein
MMVFYDTYGYAFRWVRHWPAWLYPNESVWMVPGTFSSED